MIITDKVINAINLVSRLHKDQVRKDSYNTPYVSHLFGVAMLLKSITDDEDIIVAGLMHDSLEDLSEYEYENLEVDCGKEVADIVVGVTENKALPYRDRKIQYLENLKIGSIESLIVSVADKLHNSKSFHTMNDTDKSLAQVMLYKEVLKIAKEKIDKEHAFYKLVNELELALKNHN